LSWSHYYSLLSIKNNNESNYYINLNIKKNYTNNTIGLILCKGGNEIVLKYTTDNRIFISSYKLIDNKKEINQ